jgi:hypothetical protein
VVSLPQFRFHPLPCAPKLGAPPSPRVAAATFCG